MPEDILLDVARFAWGIRFLARRNDGTSQTLWLGLQTSIMRFVDEKGVAVTVYEPGGHSGGLVWGLKQAIEDLVVSRHVIARLFWRDFISQFRQKILGYLWALIGPLLGIVSFLFLYFVGVLNPGEGDIPYPLYMLIGSTIWSCLPGAMGAVSGGLQAQADLIMRTRIPKLALAVSSLAGIFYGVCVNMVTIVIIFLVIGKAPSAWLAAYPLLAMPMILLGTAMGLVLAVVGPIARDLTPMVSQALSLLMYVTPIVYVRSSIHNSVIKTLINYNPLTYLIDVPRSLVCLGHADNWSLYLWWAFGGGGLVIIGIRIFYLLEDLVAERL